MQFRHLLDSPEQGLLVVPLFNDILPQSGGTHIATDSIGVVSRFLVNPRRRCLDRLDKLVQPLRSYRSRREAAEIAVGRGSLETPLNASRFVHNAALS